MNNCRSFCHEVVNKKNSLNVYTLLAAVPFRVELENFSLSAEEEALSYMQI